MGPESFKRCGGGQVEGLRGAFGCGYECRCCDGVSGEYGGCGSEEDPLGGGEDDEEGDCDADAGGV